MAKTLRKDTRHTIAKTWPRFVSIACLMVLAVFALVGLKVTGLTRVRIGGVVLGKLPVGQWRYLGPGERF